METKHLYISGYGSYKEIEDIFSSSMIDVASVSYIRDKLALITPEIGISIDNEEDRNWIIGLLKSALNSNGINDYDIIYK